VGTKVMEILMVMKQAAQNFDVKRFNLKKLSELEVRKQYQIKILDRFADLENLNDYKDINVAWKTFKRISAKDSPSLCERKQHKLWFDEEC
jgi:hypothetical protein